MVHFGELLKIWSLRSNSVTRKLKNSDATFWVIFKHCDLDESPPASNKYTDFPRRLWCRLPQFLPFLNKERKKGIFDVRTCSIILMHSLMYFCITICIQVVSVGFKRLATLVVNKNTLNVARVAPRPRGVFYVVQHNSFGPQLPLEKALFH